MDSRLETAAWIRRWIAGDPPENVWLGVTAENQKMADLRIPMLLDIPASVHFLSMEPLLGPVDLSAHISRISWVICGGESGPGARPMNLQWVRDIRRQCADALVPFFMSSVGDLRTAARLRPDLYQTYVRLERTVGQSMRMPVKGEPQWLDNVVGIPVPA